MNVIRHTTAVMYRYTAVDDCRYTCPSNIRIIRRYRIEYFIVLKTMIRCTEIQDYAYAGGGPKTVVNCRGGSEVVLVRGQIIRARYYYYHYYHQQRRRQNATVTMVTYRGPKVSDSISLRCYLPTIHPLHWSRAFVYISPQPPSYILFSYHYIYVGPTNTQKTTRAAQVLIYVLFRIYNRNLVVFNVIIYYTNTHTYIYKRVF